MPPLSAQKNIITLALSCALLTACTPSENALSKLASQGKTQPQAPVQATSTIVIGASAHQVWAILTNFQQWPRWNHDVERVEVVPPVGVGTTFVWISGGTTISSRVAMLMPDRAVSWTGRASMAKAIHVITFQTLDASHTRIVSSESMDGPLLSMFYSSHDLKVSEDRLLQNLKAASESSASHK
jgi:uncharacterized membrane protein